MGSRDPRIDAYIAGAAAFARPILDYLRDTVHAYCPEVEEAVKWGSPYFAYRGRLLCGMAGFKQHCSFGFWKGELVVADGSSEAMGQFGRIASLDQAPAKEELGRYIRLAMQLNDADVSTPRRGKAAVARPPTELPDDLAAALQRNRKAAAVFAAFAPSQRREYVEWITEAKRAETRSRRLAQTIEWVAQGKPRHWKYKKA